MPLALVGIGQKCIVKGFACSCEVRMRMVNMGFIPGSLVEVMSRVNGTLLVRVGQSRLMLDCCLATQIQVI
ncbi:ferrous iron transport protein A [Pelosinus sp. sgz500959]|uniref:FeoA family protein n=1 Tax=Pelosinus sp. sgz500959 TaxID=3242472 RepID=UPI00366B62C9